MFKFCQYCGTKNNENCLFCKQCGNNISENKKEIENFEKQIAYTKKQKPIKSYRYIPNNNQTHMYNNKKKSKIFAGAIITVILAAMLITTAFAAIIQTEINHKDEAEKEPEEFETPIEPEKIDPIKYGPKVSLHSLSGGAATSIPQKGAKATYGLYDKSGIFGETGIRIGKIVEQNLGEKTYQKQKCILVKTEGALSFPMKQYKQSYQDISSDFSSTGSNNQKIINMIPDEIPIHINSDYYLRKNDYTPEYMDYKIDYTEFFEIMKEISIKSGQTGKEELDIDKVIIGFKIDWNKEESKADMEFYTEGLPYMSMDSSYTLEFSEEYWNMCPDIDELYVGFEKIVNFTIDMKLNDLGYSIEEIQVEPNTIQSKEVEAGIQDYSTYNKSYDYEEQDYSDYTYSVENTIKIKVIDEEDLYLKCGNFTDCLVIEIEQTQNTDEYNYHDSSSTSSTKIWINENGVMPKAEYSFMGTSGMTSYSNNQKLIMILEEYTK